MKDGKDSRSVLLEPGAAPTPGTREALPDDGASTGRRLRDSAGPVAIGVVALAVWQAAVTAFGVPTWLLPAPTEIAAALVTGWSSLASHALITLQEAVAGFVASLGFGVAVAVVVSRSRLVERTLYPWVVASQTIPIIAIAPILLIWFGYGLGPKVIVVVLLCFFPIAVNTVDGLKSVDPDLVNLLRTMGATRWQIFAKAQWPAALPYLLSGTKVAVAFSVVGAVIGEWVGSQAGLGYVLIRSASQFQTPRLFAAIVVLAAMGIALFAIVALVERRVLRYRVAGEAIT